MRAAVERDDADVVNQLVADGDEARCLHDLVRVAEDVRHHRAGHAACDAALPQIEVVDAPEGRIRVEAARLPNSCVDDALDAGVLERIRRPDSLSSGGRDWGDLSVRRIDDQPRATAFRDLERVAKLKRAYSGRAIDHLLVSFRKDIRQLRTRHILDSSSGKLSGTFERRALLGTCSCRSPAGRDRPTVYEAARTTACPGR